MGLDESDLREPVTLAQPRRLVELLVGDVHPDDVTRLADQQRRAEDVGTRSRAEVEHRFAGLERGEIEVMPTPAKDASASAGIASRSCAGISEALGQAPAQLEVELRLLPARHVAVHGLDLRLQAFAVHERARVELLARSCVCPCRHGEDSTPRAV